MCAMCRPNEEEVKYIRQLIPAATSKQVDVFKNCMQSEAIYKAALPYSMFTMAGLHFILPKRFGAAKSVITVGSGLVAYIIGKVKYTKVCGGKAFGKKNWNEGCRRRREQLAIRFGRNETYGREANQSGYAVSTDNLLDKQSEWKTFDSGFDSDTNVFNDTSNHLQENETNVQQQNIEKRVTYDDLWRQHMQEETQGQYRNLPDLALTSRVGPGSKQGQKMPERSETYEAETEEQSI